MAVALGPAGPIVDPIILSLLNIHNANPNPNPQFTALYPGLVGHQYYAPLMEDLINTVRLFRDGAADSNPLSLLDIIRHISNINPLPITQAERQDISQYVQGAPMAGGVYGDVYSLRVYIGIQPIDIIVKVSKEDNAPALLRETFFNYRIVNEFILRGMGNILVPTYGFFLCDKPAIQVSSPVCALPGAGTGFPWMNMIQQNKTNTMSFFKAIRLRLSNGLVVDDNGINLPIYNQVGVLTLLQVQQIVSYVFSGLIAMQESPYEVNHNDLHLGNILLAQQGPVILDWGMVSFTYKGIRYKSGFDVQYSSKFQAPGLFNALNSGATDAYFLFNEILNSSLVQQIRDWANQCLIILFRNNIQIRRNGIDSALQWTSPQPWLLEKLIRLEQPHQHNQNLAFMNSLSYRNICTQLSQLGMGIVIVPFALPAQAYPFPVPAALPFIGNYIEELGMKMKSKKSKSKSKRKERERMERKEKKERNERKRERVKSQAKRK